MHALPLALALAAAAPSAEAQPPVTAAPMPVSAPTREAPVAPVLVVPDRNPASPSAPPPPRMPASGSTPASPPSRLPVAPLPQAAIDKLGQGDRAYLERDYRTALFAYQDAVYLAPTNPTPRVKLGRAYLALRYPAQALAQAEQALAADPANAEALKLAEEARNPPARPAAAAAPQAAPGPASAAQVARPPSQPHVYRFTPDPEPVQPAPAAAPASAGRADGPPAAAPAAADAPRTAVATADPAPADPAVAAAGPTAAQRYRAALELLQNRDFEKAVAVLGEAIALDPKLAVAYAARASARFGLGRYLEAADDYRAAIALEANLGTPLYGLAECYRVLGDAKGAADMYQRYAESRARDVREDLRAIAAKRATELR